MLNRYDSDFSTPTKKRRSVDSVTVSPAASVAPMLGQQRIQVVVESPDGKAQLPTPAVSSQPEPKKPIATAGKILFGRAHIGKLTCSLLLESSEDEPSPRRKSLHKFSARQAKPILSATTAIRDGHTALGSDSEEDIVPAHARRPRAAPIGLSSEAGSQAPPDPVTPKRKKTSKTPKGRVIIVNESSDEGNTDVPTKRLRQKLSTSPKASKDLFVASDEGDAISSEDDVVTPIRRRRNTASLRSPPKEPEQVVEIDSEDLPDEVEDLRGSNDIEIKETRTRGRQHNSARSIRQQQLEELRRRRAGVRQDSEEEEAEDGEDPSDEGEGYDPEPSEDFIRRGDNLDEYEEDFVDDENDNIGVDLGRAGVPLEFTYHANKKTIDHFTTEIEWMVHNKINPAFDRYDEIYLLAHDKLDHEFKGYAGSKFVSSVWRPNFDKALKARPEFSRLDIPAILEQKCEACNRSNHPPKHKVTFTGKPYNKNTLEAIEDDEDDSSDDESEEKTINTEDEESFFLGR